MLLRLYTSLLPALRQAALQSSPSWAGSPEGKHALASHMAHDVLTATIRREAAAVLNVGRVFHSEGDASHSSVLCYLTCMHTLQQALA